MTMSTATLLPARADWRRGFTIVELVIAMFLITSGLLGTAALMATSQRYQRSAAAREEMMALAEARIDQMRMFQNATKASRLRDSLTVGGSTTASVANYADSLTGLDGKSYRRRWRIANTIVGTRSVLIRVEPRYTDHYVPTGVEVQTLFYIH
jgi:type II secretory pathway component PulJ